MNTPKQLSKLFSQGINILQTMREDRNIDKNTAELIEVSYDLQTGSYQKKWSAKEREKHYNLFTKEISDIILSNCNPDSIMEAGVGEATTFSGVLTNLPKEIKSYCFDISWSRLSYAQKWLEKKNLNNTTLCTGNLFNIPFLDNSVDVVYTFHSIEPNGGNEEPILKELYRVTNKYLILFEPDYENTTDENKKRMSSLGYCKGLVELSLQLGYHVIEQKKFLHNLNSENPTAVTIIKKDNPIDTLNNKENIFACPKYNTPLVKNEIDNVFFSEEALCVYPIIGNIPCLRKENSVFASKYNE
ncbi:class I SAM-dependent methyltransferase [Arcobacteraceae bacterium]|nr:class I SAM-dependent methyltransferase [Arcobacteraceae bacterium]